jgi:hypothetical protein
MMGLLTYRTPKIAVVRFLLVTIVLSARLVEQSQILKEAPVR